MCFRRLAECPNALSPMLVSLKRATVTYLLKKVRHFVIIVAGISPLP
jgi:hypothetical protein